MRTFKILNLNITTFFFLLYNLYLFSILNNAYYTISEIIFYKTFEEIMKVVRIILSKTIEDNYYTRQMTIS